MNPEVPTTMTLEPYRRVLALPGVRPLILLALLARVPVTAAGITLTLHVVLELRHGYGAAGLVGAASTVGSALGAPLLGRLVDRRGLRLMLGVTTVAEAVFWSVAPVLPYPALLVAAFAGGLLTLPVFSVIRQSVAALVPEAQRRPAYALDSMSVELSFMAGPALAVFVITSFSAQVAMAAVGAGTVLAGVALFALNPPVRGDEADEGASTAPAPRRREWLRPRLVALLAVATATTVVLGGTDVALVAALREAGQVSWTGAVVALWAGYSLAGGFVFGMVHRPLSPLLLTGLLGAFTIPVGLAGDWRWLCLAMVPAGALCAPSLAAGADAVSRLAPAGARGEAMGLHGSALTVGMAVGAPLAGSVIDATTPAWGFAVAGLVGGGLTLAALPLAHTGRDRTVGGSDEPAQADQPDLVRVPD
ncbi:MAG: MFS transporter [Micromonosporaceae bacterium]|jgi:MFS family permease|nr:MFS transporter [Micromonosporaceae bacterium]